MASRPSGRGNSTIPIFLVCLRTLQWGRDQVVAEMKRNGPPRVHPPRLQWGRDQVVAEISIRRSIPLSNTWPAPCERVRASFAGAIFFSHL